jgi:hypothetical protein
MPGLRRGGERARLLRQGVLTIFRIIARTLPPGAGAVRVKNGRVI